MKQLVILIFVLNAVFAQIGNSQQNSERKFLPTFFAELINGTSDEQGKSKVDIYFQFPYSSLQFVKLNDEYVANYTVTIEAINKNTEDLVKRDVYDEKLKTRSYDASISGRSSKISVRSFLLEPGEYKFNFSLFDNESSNEYGFTVEKEIVGSDNNLFISDIILIKNSVEVGGQKQYVPNISRVILDTQKDLSFYFDTYSDSDKTVKINYKLIDADDNQIFEIDEPQVLKTGKNTILKTFSHLNLGLGKYTILVSKAGNSDDKKIRKKVFRSIIRDFPISITDLDLAIKQMKYLATPEEMDVFDNDSLTYRQKMERFVAFWKTKDPDPSTPRNEVLLEYYRRVEFANRRFKSYTEGWRSDMGYIYILFGNPDSVDRNPFNIDSKPYEVWYYNSLNRRFIFVDYTGFGEYRLVNNDYRDMRDFRY